MSDIATLPEGGGLLKGKDGKLSGRKLRAWIAFGAGIAALGIGLFRGGSALERIVAGGVLLAYTLIESGLLTWQAVKEIISAQKGGNP
jgi:hypothetical protein